jgi:nitrogen regulatory protein PII
MKIITAFVRTTSLENIDGLIAVSPLDHVIEIRTKKRKA